MSFILDALRKAEERQQDTRSATSGSRVLSFPGSPPSGSSFPWIWLLLLLLPAALLIGWWMGRTPPVDRASIEHQTAHEAVAPAVPEQAPEPASSGQPKPAVVGKVPTPERTPPRPVVAPIPAPPSTPTEAPKPVLLIQKSITKPAEKPDIVDYSDLSGAARSHLPTLEMSLHFYSPDPARRVIRLNGQLLHEGESLPQGPRVQKITATAAILSADGITFRIGNRK
jgi:general secretion pathway protein B